MRLTTDRSSAIPITSVTKTALPDWLERHPENRAWVAAQGFAAEPGEFVFIPGTDGRPERVLAAPHEEAIWAFAGLPFALPQGVYALEDALDAKKATDAAIGWCLGAYVFDRYKKPKRAASVLVWPENADRAEVERLSASVSLARDLINTPAEDLGPPQLAAAGEEIAKGGGARVRIVKGDALLSENYPCIHAVGRASVRPPHLFDMRWGEEDAPKVTLVGKGVCFDTGGLDLKSADGMLEMKKDMGGAAIVLSLAKALMDANAPIRLRVLVPAVENSVSANAYRPRDIIKTRAGKTVEVGNTDAEGRLILCDALADADSETPDLLVDCATLTGAARVALGPELQALYCEDDETAADLLGAAKSVGDPLWRMPVWRPYRKLIDGKCADLNNVSHSPYGGSIIGALYLAEFVSAAQAWAHLDVMGANLTARPGRPEGGEATGMRALYAYLRGRYG
jgi:leucyl aminopeptidase